MSVLVQGEGLPRPEVYGGGEPGEGLDLLQRQRGQDVHLGEGPQLFFLRDAFDHDELLALVLRGREGVPVERPPSTASARGSVWSPLRLTLERRPLVPGRVA